MPENHTESTQNKTFTVPEGHRPERLDKWLARQMPEVSRTRIQEWIRDGHVLVQTRRATPGTRLEAGLQVDVHPPADTVSAAPEAETGDLDILYEDDAVLAVNKPAGLVVHPAPGHPGGTLINLLLGRYPDLEPVGDPLRPGVIHRLDADTSGVILFARTVQALEHLQQQFRSRKTSKTYLALCHGIPSPVRQEINLPIGRHPVHRKKRAVHGEGAREAVTRFQVTRGLAGGRGALLEVSILTGRTHQIRVHLAHNGHPVLGDRMYGGKRTQLPSPLPGADRQMLHAARIGFSHPVTEKAIEVAAPLASDMQIYMYALS